MKWPLGRPARAGTEAGVIEDLELARVRRRGESRLLAIAGAGLTVFVALAVAKPWGAGSPIARANPTSGRPTGGQSTPAASAYATVPAYLPSPYIATGANSAGEYIWYCVSADDPAQSGAQQAVPIGSNGNEVLVVPAGGVAVGAVSCEETQVDEMVRMLESARPSSR
jgi:hypothetical protein